MQLIKRNIIEFSGLGIVKKEKDNIRYNSSNRLNKANNIERSLSSMNINKKRLIFSVFIRIEKIKKLI